MCRTPSSHLPEPKTTLPRFANEHQQLKNYHSLYGQNYHTDACGAPSAENEDTIVTLCQQSGGRGVRSQSDDLKIKKNSEPGDGCIAIHHLRQLSIYSSASFTIFERIEDKKMRRITFESTISYFFTTSVSFLRNHYQEKKMTNFLSLKKEGNDVP